MFDGRSSLEFPVVFPKVKCASRIQDTGAFPDTYPAFVVEAILDERYSCTDNRAIDLLDSLIRASTLPIHSWRIRSW